MNKILAILMVLAAFALVSCNKAADTTAATTDATVTTAPATDAAAAPAITDKASFIAAYEKLADDIVAIADKYAKDPKDATVLADYAALQTNSQAITAKATEFAADLTADENKKIQDATTKMADAAAKMVPSTK